MSNFPITLDDDSSIFRCDDNITELGADILNQLRSAVFSVESNLGLSLAGSLSDASTRFNVSHNPDGTIKASALSSIGLVTLPITNAQVGNTAGILESKLHLDYGTAHLNTLIQANSVLLASLSAFEAALETKLNSHIAGGPASNLRHVLSQIDVNAHPTDSRDSGYSWPGLINKDGYNLSATNLADALLEINDNLTGHQNQTVGAHEASAISVDTSSFSELLLSSDNVQKALQNIDNVELLQLGTHREVHHSNGVPNRALALNLNSLTTIGSDGYNIQVVAPTPITAHVAHAPPGTNPVDNITNGDSIVSFFPTSNTGAIFDAQFSQVKVGDIIRINYGIGIEDLRRVESIKYVPGSNWTVRINGVNLRDTDGYTTYARIDRPLYDTNTTGVLAVAAANAVPLVNYSILGSVIVSDPRGANALGINFNPGKISINNYNLYLQLYPSGSPTDHVITLPAIDVSGDAGQSTGKYTLESIVQATNNAFRKTGYNYRFIAYSSEGNFGISLADSIDGAAFAIISGSNSTGSLTESTFTNNVVGDVYGSLYDGLGFGINNANIASPAYQSTWVDSTAAQIPTKVIHPVKSRNYIVNGRPFDGFKAKPLTTGGFWAGEISARTSVGSSIEVTYKINAILDTAGLKPGKTIVVQPAVSFSDGLYNDVDYGRFIIKDVIFNPCQCLDEYTLITVISGIHGTGNPLSSSSAVGLPVRLYFSEDSVGFNDQNIIDTSENSINYHRLFEIYVTDSKTTFAHERARMPYQTASGNLITSNCFHIDSVSPKFRGYRDSGSTLNKYIRFYVLNYNIVTGEYDAYLGQRNPSDATITKTGPVVRARKNVTARFYDDTNVDYIDLTFIDESNTSPGLSIIPLPGGVPTPSYVDIELFDTLETDGELLLLATCEVNWNPDSGKNIVDKVVNRKQYGSISELEFTQSAKNYIAAGERYLHGNGIIRGFDIPTLSRPLQINGGLAFVNGKFVITNPTTINMLLCTNNSSPPQTLDWILCVNENGNLINLPLTATKTEFFAKDTLSGLTYYIDSVSFVELAHRKDLTPLYIYNVTVTTTPGLIINNVYDVRKYVKTETSLIPLVWSGKDGYDTDSFSSTTELAGHFNTFEQVKNWINWTKSPSNVIKLHGTITSGEIDLTTINYPVIFDGSEGCVLQLNSFRGMKLKSNITLKNINFNWSPGTQTYIANDNINLDTSGSSSNDLSGACLYVNGDHVTGKVTDLTIDNCKFTGIFPQSQRPPYIALIGNADNNSFENIKIINNKFTDGAGLLHQCAIAFLGENTAHAAYIANSTIENNITNNEQSIIFTSTPSAASIIAVNTSIRKNNVGAIGYIMSDFDYKDLSDFLTENYSPNIGLIIADNTAIYIGTLNNLGKFPAVGVYFSVGGQVIIERNFCNIIYTTLLPTSTLLNDQSLIISKNILKPKKLFSDLTATYGLGVLVYFNTNNPYYGIFVNGNDGSGSGVDSDSRSIQINNNTIGYYRNGSNTLFQFDININTVNLAGMIKDNIIKHFSFAGIVVGNDLMVNNAIKMDIIGNQISLPSDTADTMISVGTSQNLTNVTIMNNFLDRSIMPSTHDVIKAFPFATNLIRVTDNTNQPFKKRYRAFEIGKVTDYNSFASFYSEFTNNIPSPYNIKYFPRSTGDGTGGISSQLAVSMTSSGSDVGISWVIPLGSLFNENVKLVNCNILYEKLGVSSTRTITLRLMEKSFSSSDDNVVKSVSVVTDALTLSAGSLTLTPDAALDTPAFMYQYRYLALDVIATTGTSAVTYISDLVCNFIYL